MNRMLRGTWVLAAWGCLALSQINARPPQEIDSPDDKTFAIDAASAGMKEVALGELAGKLASSAEVKQFGNHMVDDHTKANQELNQIATRKGIRLPNKMSVEHQAIVDKLSKLKGAEFDTAYARHMVESHQEAIKKFESFAKGGQDPDLKAFATNTLPTLKEHLVMAEKLQEAKKPKEAPKNR